MNTYNRHGRAPLSPRKHLLCAALLVLAAGLSGCKDKGKAADAGPVLATVNGEKISALQLKDEMQRANVPPAQQDQASKQLLDALIDRQLVIDQAEKDKLDRDPQVVQAIERAKALIIAQAYMQKKVGNIAAPTDAEVSDYFQKHPEFFSKRKAYALQQIAIESKDVSEPLKQLTDKARSLDEVAAWLTQNNVRFLRNDKTRTTAELAPQLSAKLDSMPLNQLFMVGEGPRTMLVSIAAAKEAPVTLEEAAPQIRNFLGNQRSKEAADAELKRLRAGAKIEYVNKAAPAAAAPGVTEAK